MVWLITVNVVPSFFWPLLGKPVKIIHVKDKLKCCRSDLVKTGLNCKLDFFNIKRNSA